MHLRGASASNSGGRMADIDIVFSGSFRYVYMEGYGIDHVEG